MDKLGSLITLIFFSILSLPSFAGVSSVDKLALRPENTETRFRADTIFQIDTVYQYEIIYDTLYYFDSIPQSDTLMLHETIIENTDSAVIVNALVNFKIIESKRVFTSNNQEILNNSLRDFGDDARAKQDEGTIELNALDATGENTDGSSKVQVSKDVPLETSAIFTRLARDTIYRWDTIVNYEARFDTIVFESQTRSDTSISNFTEYEKYGRTVLAKEVVNVKVVQKEKLFVEKPQQNTSPGQGSSPGRSENKNYHSTAISNSKRFKRDMKHASRSYQNDKSANYTTYLKLGAGFFNPEINFSAENEDAESTVKSLNENTQSEASYAVSLSYSYFRNKWGFETGLGLSKQNYNCGHQFQVEEIDTSFYWEYYEKEDFLYDTTWYINIDTLLQTGDTLFVPNVDSTMIWVNDSIYQEKYDTSYSTHNGRSNFSFSYLEIPIIGKYSLIEKKVFLRLAVGVIPTFLIAKSGSIAISEANGLIEVNDITFDYGFSLSAYGSFVLGYNFTNSWALYVEPFIKQNLFSAMRNDDFLIKTNAWGIQIGITYRLFSFSN